MNKISSGLLMLLAAGALGVFWVNGYLAAWTGEISARVGGASTKTPIVLPTVLPTVATRAGGIPLLPAIQPIAPIRGTA